MNKKQCSLSVFNFYKMSAMHLMTIEIVQSYITVSGIGSREGCWFGEEADSNTSLKGSMKKVFQDMLHGLGGNKEYSKDIFSFEDVFVLYLVPDRNNIVQLILFIVDSQCTKNITGNLKLLCNFIEKFLGTVRFGNDQFAPILGYGDLNQGNVTIKQVYYVEGLNHNLFSVGSISDARFGEDGGKILDKMKEKGDPCVMMGYSTQSKGYRVYDKRTRLIVESIHIKFDEIKEMMSDHNSSDLAPQRQEMSVENVSSGLVPQGQKASVKVLIN
ncbi:hypothetical protein Tco_0295895 [Tanacetum coccineum]